MLMKMTKSALSEKTKKMIKMRPVAREIWTTQNKDTLTVCVYRWATVLYLTRATPMN